MTSITIHNIDDGLQDRLCARAKARGHSVEDEAREILRRTLPKPEAPFNLAAAIRSEFAPLGGVELELPSRDE